MLFCERSFGVFLFVWGVFLILDSWLSASHVGLFYGRMQEYMPSWAWGTVMIAISLARFIAFRAESARYRVGLSVVTLVLMVVIASIAVWSGLWGATAPLAGFVAYIAYWCHTALLRDLRLGL